MRIILTSILYLLLLPTVFGQAADAKLEISRLTGDFYVFTTYNFYKGQRIPANGLYLVTNAGVVMVDTPWDTTQFQPLLDSIGVRHNKKVTAILATHFHEDRTGGFAYYRQQGIKTYATQKTDELSKTKGYHRAQYVLRGDSTFTVGQYSFEVYYPGPGHTPDNIVIWFPKEKILYGGCLIKSVVDSNLGNLNDADVNAYPTTLQNVQRHCKNPRFVIPGHNDWSSTQSVSHTLEMAREQKKKGTP